MTSGDGRLRIGISQCLLGDQVRYDGGEKKSSFATELLGEVFALVPVCPEVGAGMGIPREPVKLVAAEDGARMVGAESGADRTQAMESFSIRKMEDLAEANLRGFILKSRSPSCGMDVVVEGTAESQPGLFAKALTSRFPALPVVEETDLEDPALRQNFVERVFAFDRQNKFFSGERSVGQLVMSHAQTKLQLDVRGADLHAGVAEVFKRAPELSYAQLSDEYLARFMQALRVPATVSGHFTVMKTVFDGMKKTLEPAVQKELARSLQDYRLGNVPLAAPLMLLRHYVRVLEHPRFNQQTYLEPEPKELLLRTRV
jgi:uncharacterized protein YbbK (DUF523 family)/uncharacterized protein YbgA (DUF1722 family)